MNRAPKHLRKLPWYLPHQAWLKLNGYSIVHDPENALPARAVLSGADLSGADLTRADLRSAVLSYADLSNADLSNADLRSADLRYADLRNADLRNADLSGAYGIYRLDMVDERGYQPIARSTDNGWLIHSGCRSLLKADALKHWGAKNYPDKEIGKRYVRAIKALPKCPTCHGRGTITCKKPDQRKRSRGKKK